MRTNRIVNFTIVSFICTLSFDVYVKKQIIEKLIDSLPEKFPTIMAKKK